MKTLNLSIIALSLFVSCELVKQRTKINNGKNTIEELISNLKDSKNKEIIVVAHRGDWRNAPENSLQAIQNSIDFGADMVEIDIRETKDGKLVLMHDDSIGRTTTGRGLLKDWTLDSLKTLNLLDGLRVPTNHKIPTLEEALLLAKGKILVNLDKSYSIFEKCYEIIKKTETQNQVVIKGVKTYTEVNKEFGEYLDKVYFMPIIILPNPYVKKIVDEYLESPNPPVAFEFVLEGKEMKSVMAEFKNIRNSGASIWVNSLWARFNDGHDDEKAIIDQTVYDWYIDNSIDIIQTDRPQLLLNYLKNKGLHQ